MHLHAFSYSFRVRRRSVAWRQFYRSSGPTTGLLQIKMIEKKFGDFPLSSFVDPRTRPGAPPPKGWREGVKSRLDGQHLRGERGKARV